MITLLLILSVVLGVVFGYFFGENKSKAKAFLVFSAGFLLSICVNEILPEIYKNGKNSIGIWILFGVVLQLVLESLTKGFEHGHLHVHGEKNILPFSLLIGLFIHAFLEGIPLSNVSNYNHPYLHSILIHNLPISFLLGSFLFSNQQKKSPFAIIIVTIFALSSPLGVFFGQYLDPPIRSILLAIVSGIFLHISAVIIFESNKNHQMDWQKILLVLIGMLLAFGLHLLH